MFTFPNDYFDCMFILHVTNIFLSLSNIFFLFQTNLHHTILYNRFFFLTAIAGDLFFYNLFMFMSRLTAVYTAAILNEYLQLKPSLYFFSGFLCLLPLSLFFKRWLEFFVHSFLCFKTKANSKYQIFLLRPQNSTGKTHRKIK